MLDFFFDPESVAVIGASQEEGKLGYLVLKNVIRYGYKGRVYPINPKADEILGLKAYPSVLDVPGSIDLAVFVVPAKAVNKALEECGRKGVKGAIVITAGFKEVGGEGKEREEELKRIAKHYGIRVIGPNCLGVMDTTSNLNASFAPSQPEKGRIAFTSQSGALCTAILDWAKAEGIGFSRFVSIGNKADVDEMALFEAWRDDPESSVIMAYIEAIGNGQEFMKVARTVTEKKPIIAIKSGRTSAGSKAASSHTGSLAGADSAYDAAFKQSGIIRADTLQQLFDYSNVFAFSPIMKGNRLAIITNAGGPGILATDNASRAGFMLPELTEKSLEYLREHLPPVASLHNPIDVVGDARTDRYYHALKAALEDDNIDGVLVLLTPQVQTVEDMVPIAEAVVELAKSHDKPVLTSFMGSAAVAPGVKILNENHIPNFMYPERAVEAMQAMLRFRRWTQRPKDGGVALDVDKDRVREIFQTAAKEGRKNLGEIEAREVIKAYGVKVPGLVLARSEEEAAKSANEMGYPVVCKISSPDILHKTDMGGVIVGVKSEEEVRNAFNTIIERVKKYKPDADIWGVVVTQMAPQGREVIVGMSRDPQFGPMVMFGLGGVYVEALKDVSFRIAPMTKQDAVDMIGEIRSLPLLKGVRGEKPADLEAVAENLLKISQLVADFPEIAELDVNPLFVYEEGKGATAVDARIILDLTKMDVEGEEASSAEFTGAAGAAR